MSGIFSSKLLNIATTERNVHPRSALILSDSKKELVTLGLIANDQYDKYESMCVYLYPRGSTSKLVDVTVFFNILFYFDDLYGEDIRGNVYIPSEEEIEEIWLSGKLDNMKVNPQERNSLIRGISRIKELILTNNGNFNAKINKSLFSHLKHTFNPKEFSSVEEYLLTRMEFSGMYLAVDMIDFVYDINTDQLIKDQLPLLSQAKSLCAEIGALSNDIFSYPKERESKYNLINVLNTVGGIKDFEICVQKAIIIVNEETSKFFYCIDESRKLIKYLENSQRIVINNYIDYLIDILSASYHWQVDSKRYNNGLHFFQDMRN